MRGDLLKGEGEGRGKERREKGGGGRGCWTLDGKREGEGRGVVSSVCVVCWRRKGTRGGNNSKKCWRGGESMGKIIIKETPVNWGRE